MMSFGTDRTPDFLHVANTIRSSKINGVGESSDRQSRFQRTAPGTSSSHSQFSKMAALISSDLAATCCRLEGLSSLARQRTIFDDHSAEVEQLTLFIKEDIATLNHRIADLQSLSKRQNQQRQSTKHSNTVLMSLQTRLADMSERFKRVLEQRTVTLRNQAARKGTFSARQPPKVMGPEHPTFQPDSVSKLVAAVPSILLEDEQKAREAVGSSGVVTDFAGQQHSQQLMTVYRDQTDQYLAARHHTVQTIEHTIIELGEIFQQLATMVHEQEERIERIDSNVMESVTAVESGHSELLRYFRAASSNRWLTIKVFAILLAFFVFFVIFFV